MARTKVSQFTSSMALELSKQVFRIALQGGLFAYRAAYFFYSTGLLTMKSLDFRSIGTSANFICSLPKHRAFQTIIVKIFHFFIPI